MLKRLNTMTTFRVLLAAAVTIFFAHTTYAQEESSERKHPRPNQFIKDADQNGDRQLSFEEASAAMPHMTAERFERMDQNGDGQLTPNEMHRGRSRGEDGKSGQRGQRGRGFEHIDGNGDGQVSYEEMTAVRPNMSKERFASLDEDSDGFLSREEMRQGHRQRSGGQHGNGTGRRGNPAQHFEKADANGDGELTYDEFSAHAEERSKRMFNRMDADGNGVVSKEEMSQHRPPHRQGQRGQRHGAPEVGDNGSDSKD